MSGIGAGVGLFLCFIAFQSSEGVLKLILRIRFHLKLLEIYHFLNSFQLCFSTLGVVKPAGCKFVAGMGLSVADPATLVTLNSLSPSNYDSAKSLGAFGR